MNLKRITSAGLALVMAASLAPAALAEDEPLLIAPSPPAGIPHVNIPTPTCGYFYYLSI